MGRSVPSSICHKSDLCLIRWRNYKSLNLLKPRTQYATDTGEKFNARESADTGSESGKLKLQITIMRKSRQKKKIMEESEFKREQNIQHYLCGSLEVRRLSARFFVIMGLLLLATWRCLINMYLYLCLRLYLPNEKLRMRTLARFRFLFFEAQS